MALDFQTSDTRPRGRQLPVSIPDGLLVDRFLLPLGIGAVLLPVLVAIKMGFFRGSLDDPFAAYGYWGIVLMYLWTRPAKLESAITMLIAIGVEVVFLIVFGDSRHGKSPPFTYFGRDVISYGAPAAVASMIMLTVKSFRRSSFQKELASRVLLANVVFFYSGLFLQFFLRLVSLLRPGKYDLLLYSLDERLGQPSFLVGQILQHSSALWNLSTTSYYALALATALPFSLHTFSKIVFPINIVKMLILSSTVCWIIYLVFPACGPRYAFPENFPFSYPAIQSIRVITLSAPPNALPSLHMAAALLIWWNVRPWLWARCVTVVFLGFTGLAVLGTGEHYLIDVIVAFPFALAIQASATTHSKRFIPLGVGAGLTLTWLFFLRWAPDLLQPAAIFWVLVTITLVGTIFLEHRLAFFTYRLFRGVVEATGTTKAPQPNDRRP